MLSTLSASAVIRASSYFILLTLYSLSVFRLLAPYDNTSNVTSLYKGHSLYIPHIEVK